MLDAQVFFPFSHFAEGGGKGKVMVRPKVGDELQYRLSTDSRSGKVCAATRTLVPVLTSTLSLDWP